MAEERDRLQELDALGEAVARAKDVIARLRRHNRELAAQLSKAKSGLEGRPATAEAGELVAARKRGREATLASELQLLRSERQQIRERIARVLDQVESLNL